MLNTFAALLLLFLYFSFASSSWRATLSRLGNRFGDSIIVLLIIPYLLATNFQVFTIGFLRFIVFLTIPTLLLHFRPKNAKPFDIFHILAIFAIWIPLETDLFTLFINLLIPNLDLASSIELLPQVEVNLIAGVDLPLHKLTAILLALFLFLILYPLPEMGFTFSLRKKDLKYALIGFLGFAFIGIPTGFLIKFLRYNLQIPSITELITYSVAGYLLVALMEEILFRGIIQNLIEKRVKSETVSLIIAAIIFGMGHLNNTTRGYAVPNWGYVLMASIAGISYGWVWIKTKRVTASAITHALVNLMWAVFFL